VLVSSFCVFCPRGDRGLLWGEWDLWWACLGMVGVGRVGVGDAVSCLMRVISLFILFSFCFSGFLTHRFIFGFGGSFPTTFSSILEAVSSMHRGS
jgi:hypothetical protein